MDIRDPSPTLSCNAEPVTVLRVQEPVTAKESPRETNCSPVRTAVNELAYDIFAMVSCFSF